MQPVDVTGFNGFYPDTARIEAVTTTRNHRNTPVDGWAPVAGLEAVKCGIRPATSSEILVGGSGQGTGVPQVSATHVLKLAGYFPAITHQMRAVVIDSATGATRVYNVMSVRHTSGKSRTRLLSWVSFS